MAKSLASEGYCDVDGVKLHYFRSGTRLPPLVGLHGLIGSGACLRPLARGLEKHFDVVLPDARGHGRSDAPEDGYFYDEHADDVIGLVRELRLEVPVLLGHSMGGLTAAVAAARLGTAIRALVLIDPTFISLAWQREVHESDIVAEHTRALLFSRDTLLAEARSRHPQRSAEVLESLVEARQTTSPNAFQILTPPNPEWRALIGRIRVPTLLLLGSEGVVSVETANALQAINPLLRYRIIEGAGHGVPYDKPDVCSAAALEFLRGLGGR